MGRRRIVLAAAWVSALLCVGAWLALRSLDVDQYRPQMEREIERLTGLPVSIGAFELQLRPLLRFSALDVSIGDPELRAHAPRIDAYPRLWPLLSRRVEIGSIQVAELGLRVPDDAGRLAERWRQIEARLEAAGQGASAAFLWTVSQIRAGRASLRLGAEDGERLHGSALLRGLMGPSPTLDLEVELPFAPGAGGSLRASLRVEGESWEELRLGFRGSLDPLRAWAPPLDLRGRARWVGGDLEVSELRADGDDLEASGSALLRASGEVGLRLDSLRAGAAALGAALEALDLGALAIAAGPGAGLVARSLVLERAGEGPPQLRAGELEAHGLEARLSGERLADGLVLRAGVEEEAIRIDELRGGPLALTGRLRPAPDWSGAQLVLGGELGLTRGLLGLEGPAEQVVDRLSEIELELGLDAARIGIQGRAHSQRLGEVGVEGGADLAADRVLGAATLDLGAAAGLLEAGPLREWIEPLLRAYGPSRLEVAAEGLASAAPTLRVERAQPPRLRVELGLRASDGALALGDLTLDSELPARALAGVLPEWVTTARGAGAVRLVRDAAAERFSLELDLASMELAAGELLHKRAGEALGVALAGPAREAGWSATGLSVAGDAGALRLDLEDDGVAGRELEIDLAAWSFLLADAWSARGLLRGSLTRGASFEVTLSEVGVERSGQAVFAGLGGRLAGAGHLDGRLAAAEVDVDRLVELRDLVFQLLPGETAVWPRGGELTLRLGRVAAGRSLARGFSARAVFGESDLELRDIAFETYEGKVGGSLAWLGREKLHPQLDLRLEIAGVTGRFLDDLLFDPPRGIRGRFDAELRFAAPTHDDSRATLAGGDGLLTLTGRQGTLGRTGLATKLITALRSTEALRLRLPSLRDEGLVFDELRAKLAMERGVLEVERFELDSPSYAITASGVLDYPADRSRLDIEVDVIRGLTPLIGRVPVAGDTLKILNLRLSADGSPHDMKLRVASTRDQILGVSKAGGRVVVNGVRDALRLFRKEPGPDPQSGPDPDPQPGPGPDPDPESPESGQPGLPLEP